MTDAVTGALGYTGRYIARELLARGRRVRTLTNRPAGDDSFAAQLVIHPLDFNQPDKLAAALRGVDTFYNTYWIRFAHGGQTFKQAVANSRRLMETARAAGVRRFVHVSITNPSLDSPLPYFRGKAEVEAALRESGLSYAICRPTLVFGREDILLNNMAYLLRRSPVFLVPGGGDYRLQPVCVEDVARLAVEAGAAEENQELDAAGPETYTFGALLRLLREVVGGRARLLHAPVGPALLTARLISRLVGDVIVTRDELRGLMGNLLVSDEPPRGRVVLSAWVREHAAVLGRRYANELTRHFTRP